jgi:thymidylate synthase (FAD)
LISTQLLRHRSFTFQEFSQRYAKIPEEEDQYLVFEARSQDLKNRQNSIDDCTEETKRIMRVYTKEVWDLAYKRYNDLLDRGVAKEQARSILPLCTITKIRMTGNVRSWIHWLMLRGDPRHGAQKEHRDIADKVLPIFCEKLPTIGALVREHINSPSQTSQS